MALIQPECFKYKNAFDSTLCSVPKGVKDFAFSSSNTAIITGGGDRILRIWLRGNYNEPTGRMKGHLFIIGQIVVHDVSQLCFSCDSSNTVKIWDLRSLACLQSVTEMGNPGDLSFALWKGFLVFATNHLAKADLTFNLDEELLELWVCRAL